MLMSLKDILWFKDLTENGFGCAFATSLYSMQISHPARRAGNLKYETGQSHIIVVKGLIRFLSPQNCFHGFNICTPTCRLMLSLPVGPRSPGISDHIGIWKNKVWTSGPAEMPEVSIEDWAAEEGRLTPFHNYLSAGCSCLGAYLPGKGCSQSPHDATPPGRQQCRPKGRSRSRGVRTTGQLQAPASIGGGS